MLNTDTYYFAIFVWSCLVNDEVDEDDDGGDGVVVETCIAHYEAGRHRSSSLCDPSQPAWGVVTRKIRAVTITSISLLIAQFIIFRILTTLKKKTLTLQ